MHAHLCLVAWVFSLHPSLYFFLKSFFHLFLMSTLMPDEISMEDPLCDSSFGSMVTLDHVTPDTEVSRNWMKLLSVNEVRIIVLLLETHSFDEINNFFMNNYWNKIGIFVKLMWKISMRWKNWSDFNCLHLIHFQGEKSSKIETLPLNSQPKFRNYRMNSIVWMIREIFKDAESVRSGQSHVTSQPVFLSLFRDPAGMLSRSLGMPSRNDGPARISNTHGLSGNVFEDPTAFSSALYPQESDPLISNVSEHTSPHVMSESQSPALDPRCQSARNWPKWGKILKWLWCRPTKTSDFRTSFSQCSCSQLPTEAMLWIKEVEMVYSVVALESSCSIRGIRTPDIEVLDAKIASALNRITHDTQFKRRISLEEQKAQKQYRFLREGQIAYMT